MAQEGYPISVTLKGGKDFDAPWIVVYGNDPDEVQNKLQSVIDGDLAAKTAEAASFLRAQHSGHAGGVAANQPPQSQQRPQTAWNQGQQNQQQGGLANGTPHPEGLTCPGCGEAVLYKAFTSKAGKNIKLWSCPSQRRQGDGHYSQFAN